MRRPDICQVEYNAGSIRPTMVSEPFMTSGDPAYRFLMLAQRSMYHTTIEQDLGCVGDVVEDFQRFLEFIVVVVGQCLYPCLNFLLRVSRSCKIKYRGLKLIPASETYSESAEDSRFVSPWLFSKLVVLRN